MVSCVHGDEGCSNEDTNHAEYYACGEVVGAAFVVCSSFGFEAVEGDWVDGVSWWRGSFVEEKTGGGEGLEVVWFGEAETLLLEGLLREEA